MDDENPTEVTAGAIVTVTVTLVRRDMSTLFGDDSIVEAKKINENSEETKEGAGDAEPETQANKRPVWLKQKKGSFRQTCNLFYVTLMLKVRRKRVTKRKRNKNTVVVLNIKLKNLLRHLRRLKKRTNPKRATSKTLMVVKLKVTKITIVLPKKKLNPMLKMMIR